MPLVALSGLADGCPMLCCAVVWLTLLCAGLMLIEKLMSGLYMGENARRILLSFARDTQLFGGSVPQLLTQPGSFTTAGAQAAWHDRL